MTKQFFFALCALALSAAVAQAQDVTATSQKVAANVSPGQLKGACDKGQDAVTTLARGSFLELQKQARGALSASDVPGAVKLLMQKCQQMK